MEVVYIYWRHDPFSYFPPGEPSVETSFHDNEFRYSFSDEDDDGDEKEKEKEEVLTFV